MKFRQRVGSFAATDSAGRSHTVVVYQWYTATRDGGRVPTQKELRTVGGVAVNKLGAGEYEAIGFPPVRLRSADPAAV